MLVPSPGIKPATFCFWAGNDGDELPAGHRRTSGHPVQAHRLTRRWAYKLCTLLRTSDTITVCSQPPSRCDDIVRTTLSSYYGQRTRTPRFPERRVGARSGLSHFLSRASIWMRRARTVRPSALVNRWIYSREIGTCKYLENPPELNYHPSAGDRCKKVMYLASYPGPLLY